ncbi:hypothetical protein [Roseivirga sp. E12]|uniref:hypothetical protein n=1 Tax=Roseivirga sp. E12 TaxID=2819237 RepID=UPI001ABCF45E|nr:hypothetical protein [Roseivirga sp. E12]MBO3700742.1 hypothetical protein [Roseivirga sp. E12]
MKAISSVLVRVIVKEFYKENTGFFLVVLGLGFGFLKTPQHMDIASALAFRPIYYLVPLGLWVLYTIKTLNFFYRVKRLPENWFLTEVIGLPNKGLKPLVVYIQFLLLFPILGYSIFMTVIAFQLGQINSAIILITSNLLLLMIAGYFLFLQLVKPVDPSISKRLSNWIRLIPRQYPFLFVHHLLHRHSISLVLTKLFSAAVILGATAIFNVEGIDFRYLALGILISSAINANFSFRYYEFEGSALKLYRNLPHSRIKIFAKNSVTYLILSLPEFLVFFGNNWSTSDILNLFQIALILPVVSVLHHMVVKNIRPNQEDYAKYVFFATAFLFFVILGYVPVYILLITLLVMSLAFAHRKNNRE